MSVTVLLIIVNVVIFLLGASVFPKIVEVGILQPYRTVREKTWYELLTSGFLHAGFGHLFLNMFVLFFFGPVIEQSLGRIHFSILYFSGLIVSGIPSLIRHKDDPKFATLGASGAVESVLFAFIFLFPLQDLYIMFIPIGIPAFVFGILFIAYSIYESKRGGGTVNHEAHIAGAVWGIVYLLLFVPNTIDHLLTMIGYY